MKDFMKAKGNVGRYVVKKVLALMMLWLISKKPRSGYELMREFSEGGLRHFATPSRVYPFLKMLERMGLVKKEARMQGKRKALVYYITSEGSAKLEFAAKQFSSCMMGKFFREMSGYGRQ